MAADEGFSTRKRASKLCFALVCARFSMAFFWPRCGVWISTLRLLLFGEQLLHHLAVFEIDRHVNHAGDILLIEINLQQQRREEFAAHRTRPGLPRRTRGGRQSARCAGGRDSPRPAAARRSRRRYRRRRRRPRPSSGARRFLRRWSAGRAARRLLRSACRPTLPAICVAQFARPESLCRPSRNSRTWRTACA